MTDTAALSRRERQIMEVVWRLGEASATRVVSQIEDPPSRTSMRTIMRILEEKGHLTHRVAGREFVYRPTRAPERTGQNALRRVLHTFFGGSFGGALAAHLADPDARLDEAELRRLSRLIKEARAKGNRQ